VRDALEHPAAGQASRARLERSSMRRSSTSTAAMRNLRKARPAKPRRKRRRRPSSCAAHSALRAHASVALGAEWESDVTQAVALARASKDGALARRATLDDAGEVFARAQRLDDAVAALDESLAIARNGEPLRRLHTALRDAAEVATARGDARAPVNCCARRWTLPSSRTRKSTASTTSKRPPRLQRHAATTWRPRAYAGAADAAREAITQSAPHGDALVRDASGAAAYEAGRRMTLDAALADVRGWLVGNPA
jgi:hypothetical protein